MSQIPTLRQIQYFIAVADTLSFSRAAELCNVTQSTLSAGLNDLELILDEKLFDRSSRNVALTRMGHDLIDPARNLLTGAEEFVHAARRHRAPLSGPLTLGVIPTIAPLPAVYMLQPAGAMFQSSVTILTTRPPPWALKCGRAAVSVL